MNGTRVWSNDFSYAIDYEEIEVPGPSPIEDHSATGEATAVVTVSPGDYQIDLDAQEFGTGSVIRGRSISVIFIPNGQGVDIPV